MTTQSLTIQLPEHIFRQLARIAEQTQQPIETLVAQSVASNLPPAVDSAPAELRSELLKMQSLSKEALLEIARSQMDSERCDRHVRLLEKNKEEKLSDAERQEVTELRTEADFFVLRKTYAWAVLRWKGY